ncbi:ATP-grasp domain-containing protein [Xenorhabdus sp. 12]|uniref:ATP-grasp domain-containing protein n=1 Tax=Xenorhabdus santafensis TaxID=2582833 RepID=A0ABU4S4N7_9GAMM|nr:ATP-grasp domain-containing protein [Xenorhabdus sp. 12]MDX7986179.1 ATP-grasp domain-containing protein [Xenorhabdus sp. 12]
MKTFIFIESKPTEVSGIDYIRELGYSPILLTGLKYFKPNFHHEIDQSLFDFVYDIDTCNSQIIIDFLNKKEINVGAVLGCYDEVMITASEVALEFNLPHPNLKGLHNSFNKKNVRDILSLNGFPQPKYEVISIGDSHKKIDTPYPFVLKPVRDAGANRVFLCKDEQSYQRAILDISESESISYLGRKNEGFLIEQFLEGHFYGAELVYNQGEWHVLGVNRIFVSPHDSLCMTGISHPSDLSEIQLQIACSNVLMWVNTLGLQGGALNVEFIYTSNGPVLVEINIRIAGARAVEQILLTSGISAVKTLINFACGIEKEIVVEKEPTYNFVADLFIFQNELGIVDDVLFKEKNNNLISFGFKKGMTTSNSKNKDFGKIIGYILAKGENCAEAMSNAEEINKHLEIKYK